MFDVCNYHFLMWTWFIHESFASKKKALKMFHRDDAKRYLEILADRATNKDWQVIKEEQSLL